MKLTFINLLQYENQKYTSSASTENSMAPKAPKSILNMSITFLSTPNIDKIA